MGPEVTNQEQPSQSSGTPANPTQHPTEALTRVSGTPAKTPRFNLGGELEEITPSVPTFAELKERREELEEMRQQLGQWHRVQRRKNRRLCAAACSCGNTHDAVYSLERIVNEPERDLCAVQSTRQIKLTVDSGACDHVIPPHLVSQPINKNTSAVRSGLAYSSASGHRLPNLGEVKVQGEVADAPNDGGIELTMQVAQVKNPLASVKKMCAAGNRVVFEPTDSYVEHIQTGARVPIISKDGSYHVMLNVPVQAGDERLLQQNRLAALRNLISEEEGEGCGSDLQPVNSENSGANNPSSSSSGFHRHA